MGVTGRVISKLPWMGLCFFICEMGIMVSVAGIKRDDARIKAVRPHWKHLKNAASAATVGSTCLEKKGLDMGGQLELSHSHPGK